MDGDVHIRVQLQSESAIKRERTHFNPLAVVPLVSLAAQHWALAPHLDAQATTSDNETNSRGR
jgi:hypothetical protein